MELGHPHPSCKTSIPASILNTSINWHQAFGLHCAPFRWGLSSLFCLSLHASVASSHFFSSFSSLFEHLRTTRLFLAPSQSRQQGIPTSALSSRASKSKTHPDSPTEGVAVGVFFALAGRHEKPVQGEEQKRDQRSHRADVAFSLGNVREKTTEKTTNAGRGRRRRRR